MKLKLTFISLIVLSVVGCKTARVDNLVNHTTSKESTKKQTITLTCPSELNTDNRKLCDYWQHSGKLNINTKAIDLSKLEKTYRVNPIHDLSTNDTAFYAKSTLKDKQIYIFPNSWIHVENADGTTEDYICQSIDCNDMFLWDFVNESIARENPSTDERMRQTISDILNTMGE